MTQQPTDLEQRLAALEAAQAQQAQPASQPVSLDEMLGSIDPADSESAIKLFNWLLKNGRLHKMGTLDGVGYIMAYQEPKGSTREGWTHGGTQGDRVVEEAIQSAQANGVAAIRGLCPKCYSVVTQSGPDEVPIAENTGADEDPKVCRADGGAHQLSS